MMNDDEFDLYDEYLDETMVDLGGGMTVPLREIMVDLITSCLCLFARDIGLPECDQSYPAYVNPECPQHGYWYPEKPDNPFGKEAHLTELEGLTWRNETNEL